MAVIAAAYQYLTSLLPDDTNSIGHGLVTEEDITAGAACYITSTGGVKMSGGSGVAALTDAGATVVGFTPVAVKSGRPITLYFDVELAYVDDSVTTLVLGGKLYLDVSAATKGRLATTSPGWTPDMPSIALNVDSTHIFVRRYIP